MLREGRVMQRFLLFRGPFNLFRGPSSGRGRGVFLQASAPVHLGVDYLNGVRHVSRSLDEAWHPCPSVLVKDGNLNLLIDRILCQRERDTVRVLFLVLDRLSREQSSGGLFLLFRLLMAFT